jgi:uncharacterized protein (TIGR02058 family)
MPRRVILELGSGNDLHGSDYAKAALRTVQDALHHSSLSFLRSLKIDKTKLNVEVTIGVQRSRGSHRGAHRGGVTAALG